jgi:hypothetical protein
MIRIMGVTFAVLGWAWWELSGGAAFAPGDNGLRVLASLDRVEQTAPPRDALHMARADTAALAPDTVASEPAQARSIAVETGLSQTRQDPTPIADAAQAADPSAPVVIEAVSIDYRFVTGGRVNLRSGPGTSFAVLSQLVRGDEVEVLSDPGAGWVKLRVLDGNGVGWMADAFLVAGR